MTVDPAITLATVKKELARAQRFTPQFGWQFSALDEAVPAFTVILTSSVDGQRYVMEFILDNYPEWPPLTDFIHPETGEKGTKRCYPRDEYPEAGGLFHDTPCICHPSCRKAYGKYRGPHGDWDTQIANWRSLAGGVTSIPEILLQVQARINAKGAYKGRMAP